MDKIRRSSFILLLIFVATGVFYGVLSSEVSAENISMSATINPSMTLNIDNTSPSISVTPSSSGTFSSTNIQVGIYSNGYIGYNLMMTPASSNLTGTTNSDNIIPTLENTSDCAGGTACSSNAFAPGHWGIAINNGNYSPAAATELVSIQNSDSSTSINEYDIYLGANLDLTTALDNYATTITFAATPTIKTYEVTFNLDSNISSIAINGPNVNNKTISYGDSESDRKVQLYYATDYDITVNAASGYDGDMTIATGDPGSINNGVFTVGAGNSVINVTGVEYTFATAFQNAGKAQKNGYYKMQDMDSTICSAVSNEQEAQLIDDRDDKVYWVAKLKDGRCWMTQNLDHDIVDTDNFYTYYNTDIGHGADQDKNATWTGTATHITSDKTWNDSTTSPESYDPGDRCWDGVIIDMNSSESLTDGTNPCGQNGNHYHVGNYYNWTASVAVSDSSSYIQNDEDADRSICPAGWMLSKSQNGSSTTIPVQWVKLMSAYNINMNNSYEKVWKSPLYLIYNGMVHNNGDPSDGSVYAFGKLGSYQTSSICDSSTSNCPDPAGTYSYEFGFHSDGYIVAWGRTARGHGLAVRCVSR